MGLIVFCVLLRGIIQIDSCKNDKNAENGNPQQNEDGDKDFTLPEIDFNCIQEIEVEK